MNLDVALFHFFNNFAGRSKIFDDMVIFFASYLQYIVIFALFWFVYVQRHIVRGASIAIISGLTARFGIVEVIRYFYHRPRPYITFHLQPLIFETEWSFPSGHSAFFFALATGVYFYNKKWGIWFFLAAIFINASRIIAGVHYPSDILGGAVVGMLVAWVVARIIYYHGKST